MREDQIQLVAFRNAELDSERLRIFGVIDFFAIFMLITVVRAFVIRTASGTTSWQSLILALVVIGYELWMLSKVQCALQASAMFSSRRSFPRTERHALPFGILPSFHSDPPVRVQLHSGDLVVLATDGFFEWENEHGEQSGLVRLEESIRSARESPPAEIITRLYETVNACSRGTKQQDDLTAVIIKRL